MHISWLGNTAIKIQTKPSDQDITIVIDPYKQKTGNAPRSLTPHIALFTHGDDNTITLSGNPFMLSTPGECETKGVLVTAVQGHDQGEVMFRVDSENVSIGHLGAATKPLTDTQLEALSGVDVLFVPVGGNNTYDAEAAIKAVNAIEPRVVIPVAHKCDTDPNAADISVFLKEIGAVTEAPEKKVIIKKKDLPQEDMKVVVLEKE